LPLHEIHLFGKLYNGLIQYSLGKTVETALQQPDGEALIAARDSMFQNPRRIMTFVNKNPFGFSPEELEIVSSWKHGRLGLFYIARNDRRYTLFVKSTRKYEPTGDIFGVVGIGTSLRKIIPTPLPVLVRTVLLPFKGKIVYDGVMAFHAVDLGDEVRGLLNEICEYTMRTTGIITSLDDLEAAKRQT